MLAIAGGGPAGLATALFLQDAAPELARRTVVIEKARYPREKICAGAIGRRADRLLARIGVTVQVPSSPLRAIAVRTGAGELVARADEEIGRVVRRAEFDAALASEVAERGVELRQGAGVVRVDVGDDGVRLHLSNGETVRADAVVGADGVGSAVRRAAGVSRGIYAAQVIEVDTERARGDLAADVAFFDLRDRTLSGYAWDFPTPLEGKTRMSRGVYRLRRASRAHDDGAPRTSDDDVAVLLDRRVGRPSARLGPPRRFAERGLAFHEPLARPGLLLVGEAAGIDPVLGEGIAQAIFYGETAAAYLVPRLRARDARFDDWRATLSRSRVGFDLRARAAFVPFVYGSGRKRAIFERWVTKSRALGDAGIAYFGGSRVPRSLLANALIDLGLAAIG